jgi:hypothetical protein
MRTPDRAEFRDQKAECNTAEGRGRGRTWKGHECAKNTKRTKPAAPPAVRKPETESGSLPDRKPGFPEAFERPASRRERERRDERVVPQGRKMSQNSDIRSQNDENRTTNRPFASGPVKGKPPARPAGGSKCETSYLLGAVPNSLTLMPMVPTRPRISACSLSSPWASFRCRALAGNSPNVASTGIHLPR